VTAAPRAAVALPDSDLTFGGYPCTVHCSGHDAGYEWAENHDIDDPDDCGGRSQSFVEGCRAYAEEHERTWRSDDDVDDAFNEDADDEQSLAGLLSRA